MLLTLTSESNASPTETTQEGRAEQQHAACHKGLCRKHI
uniref:Uncharacterized protein n=1 Tax=Arundo donax TaxID=35708 RepID=A0A0A9H5F5_ARUDO